MARINKSQFAILGALSVRSMSAYEIKQFINRSVSFFWTEGEAQLYPTLKQLYQKNCVTYHEEEAAKAGTKKIYSITKAGRDALTDWLQTKTDRSIYRNELLLKVFFGSNQPVKNNILLLENAKKESEEIYTALLTLRDDLKNKKITNNRLPYVEIALEYGIMALKTEIGWCKNSIKKLNSQ